VEFKTPHLQEGTRNKERSMTKQTLKNFALALALLGLALIPSISSAQVGLASKPLDKNPASATAQARPATRQCSAGEDDYSSRAAEAGYAQDSSIASHGSGAPSPRASVEAGGQSKAAAPRLKAAIVNLVARQ
jgi:hypothetical protein